MFFSELFKQIPKTAKKVAIYGAGTVAYKIKEELSQFNKDIEIAYYIDREKTKDEKGLLYPIIKPYDIDTIKDKIDLVIISIIKPYNITGILELYNIPYICIPTVIDNKIRHEKYEKDYKKALDVFSEKEDKELYEMLYKSRLELDFTPIEKYAKEKYGISRLDMPRNNQAHYLEYINRNAIKTMIDCGFFDGGNSFSYKKNLKNLEKIYVFEPLYDLFKEDCFDKLIKKLNFVEIIPNAAWDREEEMEISVRGGASSVVKSSNNFEKRKICASTIDILCKKHDIKKVDFIKMDIEGAEQKALRGGGVYTAFKSPPARNFNLSFN